MKISKILDFSAGSKFAIKLPQAISNDWESQNCDWMLFSVTPLLNLADSLVKGIVNNLYILLFHLEIFWVMRVNIEKCLQYILPLFLMYRGDPVLFLSQFNFDIRFDTWYVDWHNLKWVRTGEIIFIIPHLAQEYQKSRI